MKIRCARPIKGRRERLCKTDEAKVSKVFMKDGRELVERLQPVQRASAQFFELILSSAHYEFFYPQNSPYHLIKALALATADSLFPDNFLSYHEIRFFNEDGQRYSAAYSDFIPDETGVIDRRREAMQRYYAAPDKETRLAIRKETDVMERSINPDLGPLVEKVEAAGIRIPHPEANYHVSDGKTIFFEVGAIDLPTTVNLARLEENTLALSYLVMLYASYIRVLTINHLNNPKSGDRRVCASFDRRSFGELKRTFHSLFLFEHESTELFDKGYNAVKDNFELLEQIGIADLEFFGVSGRSLELDDVTSDHIDRIIRDQF